MAAMPRLVCTPYHVSVSLAAMCNQCSLPATRRPDSSAFRTGAACNRSAMRSAVACRAARASATHASSVAGETERPYSLAAAAGHLSFFAMPTIMNSSGNVYNLFIAAIAVDQSQLLHPV